MGRPLEPVQGILEYEPRGLVEGLTVVSVDLAISVLGFQSGALARVPASRVAGAGTTVEDPRGVAATGPGRLVVVGWLTARWGCCCSWVRFSAGCGRAVGVGALGSVGSGRGEVERPGARAVVRLMCSFARPL